MLAAAVVLRLFPRWWRAASDDARRTPLSRASCRAAAVTNAAASPTQLRKSERRTAGRVLPRLALLFLITDRIEHEALWFELLSRAGRATGAAPPLVLVHAALPAEELRLRGTMAPFFLQRLLPMPVPTRWGDLMGAMRALLRAALAVNEDETYRTERFVFVSGSTVPLKSIDHISAELLPERGANAIGNTCSSMFCFAPARDWPSPVVPKAHQWSVLGRKHAALLASAPDSMGVVGWLQAWVSNLLLRKMARRTFQSDEIAFTSELWRRGLQDEVVHGCATFVWWGERSWFGRAPALLSLSRMTHIGSHPATFLQVPYEGLRELVRSEFLFARKFTHNTTVTGAPGASTVGAALLRLLPQEQVKTQMSQAG